MPNHCDNELHVRGPDDAMEEFLDAVRGYDEDGEIQPLDFRQIIPEPAKYPDKTGALPDWYEWRVKHWGTKWNAYDQDFESRPAKRGRYVVFSFNTAWAPPHPVVRALIERYPRLQFTLKYYEQGMGYAGTLRGAKGEIVNETFRENYQGGRGG